jgi:DNA helicase HerA-like ATPase
LDDGAIRLQIDPDEIESARHTCVLAATADGQEWTPISIAAQMQISLGLVELIQRHGVAKTGGLLARVRDERRACEMDVDGLPDCR